VDESAVSTAAAIAERLGLPHHPAAAVAATRDKRRMRALLARAGVPQPEPGAYALTPGLVAALRNDVPQRAVVFSDLETSYRVAAEAPVLIVAAPPAHVADTTKNDPYARRDDVIAFYRTGDLAIPRGYGADWLIVDRSRPHRRIGLRPVYADARFVLYAL